MQAIETQDKQFHDGNGTTELGTILPAWWLNQVQSELLSILAAANITPNKAKTNQLTEAIQKLFPNKNFTLTAGAGLTGGGDLSANRTIALATPSTLSGSTTNWVGNGATGHTHEIAKASATLAGVVKLVNALNSTATDAALTAAQGKVLAEQIAGAVSGGFALRGSLGSRNLNDVIGVNNYGVWDNSANVNATTAKNYPATKAGTLFLLPSAYQGVQLYIPFDLNIIYIRHSLSNDNNNWSSWRIIDETINALDSDSRTAALSAAMGKKLNEEKLGNTGTQTLNGNMHIVRNAWEKLRFVNADGSYWRYETHPTPLTGSNKRFNFVFSGADNVEQARVAFTDPNGTQTVAYQEWVNENLENKDFLKTINFADVASATYTKSGFYRANGKQINNLATPSMEIHITHPSYNNNAYARGIGFGYGGSFALTTTAWDKDGRYLGQKTILTEENGVMLSGNQTVAGVKTFTSNINADGGVNIKGTDAGYFEIKRGTTDFYLRNRISGKYAQFKDDGVLTYNGNVEFSGSLKTTAEITSGGDLIISGSGKTARFGMGAADCFIQNPTSKKYLQLKDDGTLAYSNDKILLYSDRSNAVNLDSDAKIATSKAVKIAYDKAVAAENAANNLRNQFPASLAENGWQKLPNGLIMQWGVVGNGTRARFPIAFNACFSVAIMPINVNDTWNYAFANDNTAVWVSVRAEKINGFRYIAIGR